MGYFYDPIKSRIQVYLEVNINLVAILLVYKRLEDMLRGNGIFNSFAIRYNYSLMRIGKRLGRLLYN